MRSRSLHRSAGWAVSETLSRDLPRRWWFGVARSQAACGVAFSDGGR